ncbi:hypothetical protein Pmani_031106 [Petrolisthes manimaculis]|uniref:Uncharacterized protein n=1 Tax=Petrolisthes manimaculis TaxID=1843537 RepID=A0AAE1NVZ8_9EUCA|nr:hypothetical protein Pmani_031106 [Petrolisthes manimaculis]
MPLKVRFKPQVMAGEEKDSTPLVEKVQIIPLLYLTPPPLHLTISLHLIPPPPPLHLTPLPLHLRPPHPSYSLHLTPSTTPTTSPPTINYLHPNDSIESCQGH